jgi:hypothetical protein
MTRSVRLRSCLVPHKNRTVYEGEDIPAIFALTDDVSRGCRGPRGSVRPTALAGVRRGNSARLATSSTRPAPGGGASWRSTAQSGARPAVGRGDAGPVLRWRRAVGDRERCRRRAARVIAPEVRVLLCVRHVRAGRAAARHVRGPPGGRSRYRFSFPVRSPVSMSLVCASTWRISSRNYSCIPDHLSKAESIGYPHTDHTATCSHNDGAARREMDSILPIVPVST